MKTEYELRILNINVTNTISILNKMGAQKRFNAYQKRYIYDTCPPNNNSWIRLRTNGSTTTLTLKKINSNSISGTTEIEICVNDFENTDKFLNELGYFSRSYQENYRIEYFLSNVIIDIDIWPMIPPLLEIEATSEQDVYNTIQLLSFESNDFISMKIGDIYRNIYNIPLKTEIKNLIFSETEKNTINRYEHNL